MSVDPDRLRDLTFELVEVKRPHRRHRRGRAPLRAAAVDLAITGGGALSSLETTVLLTVDETLDALRKAERVQYQQPV